MRVSFVHGIILALGFASVAAEAPWAKAADLRTASGNRKSAARASYQADGESVLMPPAAAGKLPAPKANADTVVTGKPVQSRVQHGEMVYDEDPFHGEYDHAFGNDSCGAACNWPGWVRFDYLLWWRSGMDLPPLVTTAPVGTPQAQAGRLGQPTTTILYGDESEPFTARPGGRIDLGMWLDHEECLGVGGRFFWLGDAENTFSASSATGTPILGIPFFEASNGTQQARLVGFPNTFGGALNFTTTSEVIGGEGYARIQWCQSRWGQIDLLAGYQFARINEALVMNSSVTDLVGGASNQVLDSFTTHNEFHGGMLGLATKIDRGCWYVDLLGKVGMGNMQEQVLIRGQSITTVGAQRNVLNNSGLFAQPTNVGDYQRDEFVFIPEVGANLGWRISDCVDFNIGYTFVYYSSLVRPGDAIDTAVNTTQAGAPLVGPARPVFTFNDSSFITHGLNLGVTFRW